MSALPPFSKEFLAQYADLAPLGEGAMARVFRARHLRLDRAVAIKVLKELDADQTARFRREARVLASLVHPNIVRVFDADCDGALPYLVCELVEGQPLDELQRERPLDRGDAVRATLQVGAALAHAHEHGFVHRDVKAANVLVQDSRPGWSCKLADFGFARPILAGGTVTKEGMLIGTPEYMAPECVTGQAPGPQSDQYALGVLLYWLLTGGYPFEAGSVADLLRARVVREPRPPSALAPVPAVLEAAVMRMLAREPARRFPTVAAASLAVGAALPAIAALSAPTRAMHGGAPPPPRKAPLPLGLAVAAALASALVIGAAAARVAPRGAVIRTLEPVATPSASPAPPAAAARATAILRYPQYRGLRIGKTEARALGESTGVDLGRKPELYLYWFGLADWIEGRGPLPAMKGAQSGVATFVDEKLLMEQVERLMPGEDGRLLAAGIDWTAEYPGDARGWLLIGQSLWADGRAVEARRVFQRALTLDECGWKDWPVQLSHAQLVALRDAGDGFEERVFGRVRRCAGFARSAWEALAILLGKSDRALCERMLRRAMHEPKFLGDAVARLSALMRSGRTIARPRRLLEEALAASPDNLTLRQALIDLALERGDRERALGLLAPVMDRQLEQVRLPPLVFPEQLHEPVPEVPVDARQTKALTRTAYVTRCLEAGDARAAAEAFSAVGRLWTNQVPASLCLELHLLEAGTDDAERAAQLPSRLAEGVDWTVWSEAAGLAAEHPAGRSAELLDGVTPPAATAAMGALARALAASRRGEHARALAQLVPLLPALPQLHYPLALEILARAIVAPVPDPVESPHSAQARTLALYPEPKTSDDLDGTITRLAAALRERRLDAVEPLALELTDIEPRLALGWYLQVVAALRRGDARTARERVHRAAASSRVTGAGAWAIAALERLVNRGGR